MGTGGASKAIISALQELEIPFKIVGRKAKLNYSNLTSKIDKMKYWWYSVIYILLSQTVDDWALNFSFES